MGRKALAAILLPVPFAALPIAVVAIGAVFGSGGTDEYVIREETPIVTDDTVSAVEPGIDSMSLASVTEPIQFEPCAENDLLSGT